MFGNHIVITGRVTRDMTDDDLRSTSNGVPVTSVPIAYNPPKGRSGQETVPTYIDVTVWQRQAINCVESLTKGMLVTIEGRLEERRWVDNANNERRRHIIVADHVSVALTFGTVAFTPNPRPELTDAR